MTPRVALCLRATIVGKPAQGWRGNIHSRNTAILEWLAIVSLYMKWHKLHKDIPIDSKSTYLQLRIPYVQVLKCLKSFVIHSIPGGV